MGVLHLGHTIRRKDRMLSDDMMEDILTNGDYGVLSTVNGDGQPYGVPLSYGYDGNSVYFHCATVGTKLQNISNNNLVSFTVVTDVEAVPDKFTTYYKSVIAFGTLSKIEGGEKKKGLTLLIDKYSSNFLIEGEDYIKKMSDKTTVLKLDVQTKTAKGKIK